MKVPSVGFGVGDSHRTLMKDEKPKTPTKPKCSSVYETAVKNKLKAIVAAVDASGLTDDFGQDFVGTVFLPTDAAVEKHLKTENLTIKEALKDVKALKKVCFYPYNFETHLINRRYLLTSSQTML